MPAPMSTDEARIDAVARELYALRHVTKLGGADADDYDREHARTKWDRGSRIAIPEPVRAEMNAAAVELLARLDRIR